MKIAILCSPDVRVVPTPGHCHTAARLHSSPDQQPFATSYRTWPWCPTHQTCPPATATETPGQGRRGLLAELETEGPTFQRWTWSRWLNFHLSIWSQGWPAQTLPWFSLFSLEWRGATNLGFYMSETFLFPITIEVVRHQLMKSEWNSFISKCSLDFLGIGTPIGTMETDPLASSLDTPRETFAGACNDSSCQHPRQWILLYRAPRDVCLLRK